MSDAPISYRYDVFVSYRRIGKVKPWVGQHFVPYLKTAMTEPLGREPRVFWDETSVAEGQRWHSAILDALRHSCCLVPIWSKPYFGSPWCVAEWQTFLRRATLTQRDELVVPVRFNDGEDFPPEALAAKPFDFRDFAINAPAFVQSPRFLEYESALDRLAERLVEVLEAAPKCLLEWPVVDPGEVEIVDLQNGKWNFRFRTPPQVA
jgi:hypothetical protein